MTLSPQGHNKAYKTMGAMLQENEIQNPESLEEESFIWRHIGPQPEDIKKMLGFLGIASLDELVKQTIPHSIRYHDELDVPPAQGEYRMLSDLKLLSLKNQVFRSFIGMGYADCITPPVIQRNILENPGWYTQYTPYQAEISQGRLEALLNFQTMICDLAAMDIANASLLDEATAAAEALAFAYRVKGTEEKNKFFVANDVHKQTLDVISTRALPLGVEIVVDNAKTGFRHNASEFFGCLLQYPSTDGDVVDYSDFAKQAKSNDLLLIVAADLLSLVLLKPPGEWGADVVVGSSGRFGVPFCFGGPHAAFFATRDKYKRHIPGRIVGVSRDASGNPAYRLSLQTREQHIKRERATSNICTAQVLLAVMASMYAIYHGPEGLRKIATRLHQLTTSLRNALVNSGFSIRYSNFFDTLRVETQGKKKDIITRAINQKMNFRVFEDESLGVSLDETTTKESLDEILSVFTGETKSRISSSSEINQASIYIPNNLIRTSPYLTHPVFQKYRSETELLRYMKRLESKDLSLTTSMIPLGSCTMKLNAAAEMFPITWREFSNIHPYAPLDQTKGYTELITRLEDMLKAITGFAAFSLQPNSGAQGEYAGLLVIMQYHKANNQAHRNVCLIPSSAHGTNPASAAMAGMEVIVVECDSNGNVSIEDLRKKANLYKDNLSAFMITYPSTHGVFEEGIVEICDIIHEHGGQVYMDGANLNAQVGLCRPGDFGVDVCHVNLHKTFCIPHGGGGPGVGPIGVSKHLVEYLPGHFHGDISQNNSIGPVAASAWGSAGILAISYAYIRMMGPNGLKTASEVAILNANYIVKRLEQYYPILYKGKHGNVAHECILDIRGIKKETGIDEIDIAKRLMDYGFHAPTVSFPVVGTLMVEPTESESLLELDRFCDAMIAISEEIKEIQSGKADKTNNVLKNAPHTAMMIAEKDWTYPYSREKAVFPVKSLREHKFWPAVRRIDNAYGDRNLFCSCMPVS
jgi:glycine dehydrogenase